MENLTLPTSSFMEFKFKDIGRPPALLHRFTSAHPGGIELSPSPSPPPEQHSGVTSPPVPISRPTLMQALGTGFNDADVAGAAASTSSDTISGLALQPSSGIVASTTPSVTTLPLNDNLLNASEWQLRYPSSEPSKSDPHSHPSSTPLPDISTMAAPPISADLPLTGGHSLETLIKLKGQLLSSLASYTPSNPSAAFLLAKASREQSSAALDAAQRAHTLAQQSLHSVQACANVAQEALRAAERAHSLAEDTTAAIDKFKTDKDPWTVIQKVFKTELASLTQWIEAEEKSRSSAETRRLANSARDLRTGTGTWGHNPQPDSANQRPRGSINDFGPIPDSEIVMGSPDDKRHNVELPHEQVDNTQAPDDDLRRYQDMRRLDEAMAAEAKRLEDEARDLALREDEEERLKRARGEELAARWARQDQEAEIRQARLQREKEKKQQAEEAEAQRAAQEIQQREAEEVLANRSREAERKQVPEEKRHQNSLDKQKKQREEVQRAKAQYNREQAARIQEKRAKGSSIEYASTCLAPPASIKSAIPQLNEHPHLSALEAVSTNTATSTSTVPPSHSRVSPAMPLSSLPARPPTNSLGPASTKTGSVEAQTRVEAAIPSQAPQQLSQKGICHGLSGDVKLGPASTPNANTSVFSIQAPSLGFRSRTSESSPMPSTSAAVDTAKVARAPSQPDSKTLSTAPSDIICPRTANIESQKRLSTDKHSLPPISHFPQSHLSTPESEPMVPYSSSDNGNVPIIKMEETDELLHVQEANLRHIRERSRINVSQMAKTEEADRRSLSTVSQPPKGIHSTSSVPPLVRNILPPATMPTSTLPPVAGSMQNANISAPQKNPAQISAKPSQPTTASARKSKKAKATKAPPAQETSQPSQGNPEVSPNRQTKLQTGPKVPPHPVNQKSAPTKQQGQARVEAVPRPVLNAPPAPIPPFERKTPTKPRSASPPTSQADHGRAIYNQSSYQSGTTSRMTEPRGPSPMGPEGFPSESGWYNSRLVDEDIGPERRSYDSDGYASSSNRRSRYSPPQDYPSASRSYDQSRDYYSPPPSPVPRGRPLSPIARSPSPTLGMKRRRQEEPAFIRKRRQRQEENDSYNRESISAVRNIPSPQTPPTTSNRKITPPPTLVSRLDVVYARRNPIADSGYPTAPPHTSTRSYNASKRADSPPPGSGGSKSHLLERLSNVSGPSQPSRVRRDRVGGNYKPRLAARIGNTGINDSYR